MILSEKTVKNYVSKLLAKLGMSRRTEAAVYAVKRSQERGGAPGGAAGGAAGMCVSPDCL